MLITIKREDVVIDKNIIGYVLLNKKNGYYKNVCWRAFIESRYFVAHR